MKKVAFELLKIAKLMNADVQAPSVLKKGTKFTGEGGIEFVVKEIWVGIPQHSFTSDGMTWISYSYKMPEGRKGTEKNTLENFLKLVRQGK